MDLGFTHAPQPCWMKVALIMSHGGPTNHAGWRSHQPAGAGTEHDLPASIRLPRVPGTQGESDSKVGPQHGECWVQLLPLVGTVTVDPPPNIASCQLTLCLGHGNIFW